MALTVEEIHAAADELDAQGLRPTLAAVRNKLGSGSFTTIAEAMGSWRAARRAEGRTGALPDVVADRIDAAGRDVWSAAIHAAEARTAAEREALDAEQAELRSRLAAADDAREQAREAAILAAELQGRLKALGEERDRLAADLAEAQQKIGRLEAENDRRTNASRCG